MTLINAAEAALIELQRLHTETPHPTFKCPGAPTCRIAAAIGDLSLAIGEEKLASLTKLADMIQPGADVLCAKCGDVVGCWPEARPCPTCFPREADPEFSAVAPHKIEDAAPKAKRLCLKCGSTLFFVSKDGISVEGHGDPEHSGHWRCFKCEELTRGPIPPEHQKP